jgi:hypothetical protein
MISLNLLAFDQPSCTCELSVKLMLAFVLLAVLAVPVSTFVLTTALDASDLACKQFEGAPHSCVPTPSLAVVGLKARVGDTSR